MCVKCHKVAFSSLSFLSYPTPLRPLVHSSSFSSLSVPSHPAPPSRLSPSSLTHLFLHFSLFFLLPSPSFASSLTLLCESCATLSMFYGVFMALEIITTRLEVDLIALFRHLFVCGLPCGAGWDSIYNPCSSWCVSLTPPRTLN